MLRVRRPAVMTLSGRSRQEPRICAGLMSHTQLADLAEAVACFLQGVLQLAVAV